MMLAKLKHNIKFDRDIHIISMASEFQKDYDEYIKGNGLRYNCIDNKEGIYGHFGINRRYFWIDLKIIGDKNPQSIINAFCSNFKDKDKLKLIYNFELLDNVYKALFRKEAVMSGMDITQTRGYDELSGAMDSVREEWLQSIPVEQRLKGIDPDAVLSTMGSVREEWLQSIPVEQRLKGIAPEQRLKGIDPDAVLSNFEPDAILSNFAPEQRLNGLNPAVVLSTFAPEQRLIGLKPEERKRLLEILSKEND